jgi:uncharacterized protein YwqG
LSLIDAGLAPHAAALDALALPCVRLAADVEPTNASVGGSRLGGAPDTPAGFVWPVWRDLPLAFVGQVDLAEVAHVLPGVLPPSGVLAFFYHPEQDSWGFDPADVGSARVYWFASVDDLRRHDLPASLPEHGRYHSVPLRFRAGVSLAPPQALDVQALRLSNVEEDAYFELRELLQSRDGEGPLHQLLGHPTPIQDEMQLECQLVSNGINCGGPEGYQDPRRAELAHGAREWRLLAQFDSDEQADMMWGDVGMLYFWIRESDLAARNFDRVWMILQCS